MSEPGESALVPELLVSDVDDRMLVKVIDRFFMYYIRSAERLQRTAPWVESLEGGMDHLREVILEDSLGICDELESAMGDLVADYRDEWAETLNDPVKLARFTPFINDPQATFDQVIVFKGGFCFGGQVHCFVESTLLDLQMSVFGMRKEKSLVEVDMGMAQSRSEESSMTIDVR